MAELFSMLTAISTSLNIVDKVYRPIRWLLDKRKGPKPSTDDRPFEVQAEHAGKSKLVFKRDGREIETITSAELEKLPPHDKTLIDTYAAAMNRSFELWTKIYPKLGVSADEVVNAKLELQLKEIGRDMCKNLNHILDYLDRLGKNLSDHYSNIRYLCSQLGGDCEPIDGQ